MKKINSLELSALGNQNDKEKEYWLGKLSGELKRNYFALDNSGDSSKIESNIGLKSFILPKEISAKLEKLSNGSDYRLHMALISLVATLFSKLSGEDDIIIGTSIYKQENETEFLNTALPIRFKFFEEMSFNDLLIQTRDTIKEAVENQNYPMEKIIHQLDTYDGGEQFNLFETIVILENVQDKSYICHTNYSMLFYFNKSDNGIEGYIEYNLGTYKEYTVNKIINRLIMLIGLMFEKPRLKISEIELISAEEKHQMLVEFNNTKVDYPESKTMHELFEEQVARTPDNIAVVYENKSLTYRELNEKANQLARILKKNGIGQGSIVGIMTERSLEFIIGIIGVIKAGGAYLPIDPEYPQDRIEYMLEDSGAKILLTQSNITNKISKVFETLILDDDKLFMGDISNLESYNKVDDLIYVIYTSGSTGKPKGVMLTHRGVVNYILCVVKNYVKNEKSDFPLYTSISFDLTVTSIYTPLITGNRVVIYGEDDKKMLIEKIIDKNEVDIIKLTPAHLRFLRDKDCSQTRITRLIVGGEQLENKLCQEVIERFKNRCEIYNEYGPTETSVGCMIYKYDNEKCNGAVVPIGVPTDNVKLYILDKNNNLKSMGVPGQLCVSGAGLARGYLNRPELTAERFVSNPFHLDNLDERMYLTGDLVRWLPDGNIEFIRRMDDQVKIRGYRIELGEIENKLLMHQDIKEVLVVAKEDSDSNKYLCAYIVAEKKFTVTELRDYLSKKLPDYMIPSYFVELDKMPLTINGKVNRKELPEPDGSIITGTAYEAPRNKAEEKMIQIWEDVLKVDSIGINDNFFILGGHSLKATSLITKIHKEFDVEVPLIEIFKSPTVKGISEYIKNVEKSIYLQIPAIEEKEYYEVSSAQKRIYTLQQFDVNSTSYNTPGIIEIEGEIDRLKLDAVFKKMVQRHEAFRTSFKLTPKGLVQKIHKEVEFELEYMEINKEKEIDEAVKLFIKPFDLSNAPLLRVGLIKVHSQKYVLLLDMHHIISDGISMNILIKEFISVYEGNELPELRIQYKDYVAWKKEMHTSEKIKKQEEYWLEVFKEKVPSLNIPTDYPRPAIQSFEGDSINIEIGRELTGKLKKIAEDTESTLYMVLLATFYLMISKYSGQEDIVVGSVIAGRNHHDLDNIIGMFVNTLAIRNYPKGEKTFKDFLRSVKENVLKAYENQDYQFEELIEKLNIKREMSRNPLFDLMFTMQNMEMNEITLDGMKINPYKFDGLVSKFDITLIAVEVQEKIILNFEYCSALFKKETVRSMANSYADLLNKITENLETELHSIELENNLLVANVMETESVEFAF